VPSYPAVEGAVRALARVVEYAVWLRTPNGPTAVPGGIAPGVAKALVQRLLVEHPDGTELGPSELSALLASYGISLWEARRVESLKAAIRAGRELGWDVVLKATTDRLRERPDLAHVWRNIDRPAEMKDAWESLGALIDDVETAGFVVQKNAPPGVPVSIRSTEDPLFGPVVSFGISGPLTELLEDRSYRIPPLGARDPAAMTREIKAAPMLFGYRGSEAVDVARVEDLISRVAQLQHDVPQISSLELSLVLAGADHCTVLTARARVDPVADPRSDWFVRRLPAAVDDTIPG
jgi:acyl-CoA synthetase (NDP forming)